VMQGCLNMSDRRPALVALACAALMAATACAQDIGIPTQPRAISGNFARAGNPQCVARWAKPSWERHSVGYYVGGGQAHGGEGRCVNEGTWGNDYAPWYTRVSLGWSHGRAYQDGGGQYEPDRRNNPLRLRAP
jgi:hypothetical protein